jgi:hypothetical protein
MSHHSWLERVALLCKALSTLSNMVMPPLIHPRKEAVACQQVRNRIH